MRDMLGLSGLHFIQGDANRAEWPESDRYCLMNPDLPVHAPAPIRRLESEGRRRPITIASVSSTNMLLAEEPWLEEVGPLADSRVALRLFASRPAGAPG